MEAIQVDAERVEGEAFVLRLEDEADSCVLEADSFQLSEGKPEDP